MEQSNGADLLLGIDVGGTKLAAVLGDANGRIVERATSPTPRAHDSDWRVSAQILVELAREVCGRVGSTPKRMAAVGVSCGGPLDRARGIVLNPPNLPGWRDVPLREFLIAKLQLDDVTIENDANAIALAEHRWGAGQGVENLACLTFGTGIGAGLILNGKLFHGKHDLAGEIGHAVVDPDGPECLCGKRGCLEAMASGGALDRIARARFGEGASAITICDRARQGDPECAGIVESAAMALGVGVANLLQSLDLEMVILGSLAIRAGDLFLEPIREHARRNTWPAIFEGVKIVACGLGEEAQDKAALAVCRPG
jgi:glucokinase